MITSDRRTHCFRVVSRHPRCMTAHNIGTALPGCSTHFCDLKRITLAALRVHYNSAADSGISPGMRTAHSGDGHALRLR